MTAFRRQATATLLLDGRVLIAGGGRLGSTGAVASAEVYDLTSGKFSSVGSTGNARRSFTATRLLDGRVLMAGGSPEHGDRPVVAELYDPSTGTFSPAGSMTTPRVQHVAVLLTDGRVLLAGGFGWTFLLRRRSTILAPVHSARRFPCPPRTTIRARWCSQMDER
jgi:hypothetical protein